MSTELLPIDQSTMEAKDLLHCFLSGRNKRTMEAYRIDLEDFSQFAGDSDLTATVNRFIGQSPGNANRLALSYRNALVERGLAPSTINRRLAAIRSLVKLARTLGVVTWSIEIPNLKNETYRDTRGPGRAAFLQMLGAVSNSKRAKDIRDVAILRLLYDLALRASELTQIEFGDLDFANKTIAILGKGKVQKAVLSLPELTVAAIQNWINVRAPGVETDPLFVNFDRARKGERLTRVGLYQLIRRLGEKAAQVKTRPHGIRHTSISEACKIAQVQGLGLEEVLDHSRHASVTTLMIYRDRDRNVQGKIASWISEAVSVTDKKPKKAY
jgi:integrase/recombinase XerC